MIKINNNNYEFYKGIMQVIWEFQAKHYRMDPNDEFSPLNVVDNWEQHDKSLARKGLKEGLRDSLTSIKYFSQEHRSALNNKLISRNFPSLNILTAQIRNTPKRVLSNGKIKNVDEYYVIKDVLDDVEYEITELERKTLNQVIQEFEKNYEK